MLPYVMKYFTMKKGTVRICALALLCFLSTIAGAQVSDLSIATTASGSITVCGNPITFSISITNQSGTVLQSILLHPNMPAGMTYVNGSVSGMIVVTPVNNANPAFTVSDFAVGETKVMQFNATASCDLISYMQVSGTTSHLVNNNTVINYTQDGIAKQVSEPNGSASYNVLFAELDLFVPEAENNIAADFIGVVKSRHISLKNSGLGSLASVDFFLNADAVLALQKLELVKPSGNEILTSTTTTSLGKKYTLTDFTSVGDGDNLFEEGETITLLDYVKVLSGKASIPTVYTAQWGCASKICNATDQQSVYTAYITAIGGAASVNETFQILRTTDFCNAAPARLQYNLKNSGSNNLPASRDAAFDVNWTFSTYIFTTTGDFQFYLQKPDNSVVSIDDFVNYYLTPQVTGYNTRNFKFDFANHFTQDPDGAGGLDDVDQDGYFDDLPSGNTLVILIDAKPTIIGEISAVKGLSTTHSGSLVFKNWSGTISSQNMGFGRVGFGIGNTLSQEIQGPSDLTSAKNETLTYTGGMVLNGGWMTNANVQYRIELDLPAGVLLKKATYFATNLNFSQNGTQATIPVPIPGFPPTKIDFEFGLDCGLVTTEADTIRMNMYYYSDYACPSTRIKITEFKRVVYLHCNSCNTLETTQFTVQRKTLGWQDASYYTYHNLYETSSIPRATSSTPGIRLDRAYSRDVVEMSTKGKVSSATSYNTLSVETGYTSRMHLEPFRYSSAIFIIDGVEYPLPADVQPVKTAINDSTFNYVFNIPLGTSGIPSSLSLGQTFELKTYFIVDDLIGISRGIYLISDLRSHFFAIVNGDQIRCIDFGDEFFVCKPDILGVATGNMSTTFDMDNSNRIVLANFYWRTATSDVTFKDFPNEFRPLFYPSDITVKLPKGFVFDQSKPIELGGTVSGIFSGAMFSSDGTSITLPASSIPVINSIQLEFFAYVKIDCQNPQNLFVPTNAQYDLRNFIVNYTASTFAYLPSPGDHVTSSHSYTLGMYNETRSHLQLTANSTQEGYSDIVQWPIQLCNPQSALDSDSPNTWVAVELKNDDTSTILQGAVDKDGIPLSVEFYGATDTNHPNGRNMLVKFGLLKLNNCNQFKVLARYADCQENKLQTIDVFASWDHISYPDVSNYQGSIVNRKGCEGYLLTGTMSIKYRTADLQWNVIQNGPNAVNLCVPVDFDIDLASTKYGDMSQVKVWVELPHDVTFDASNPPRYNYPYTASAATIPAAALINANGKTGWDITSIVGGNLPGTRLADNKLRLDFNLTTNCGYDPGLPIKYTVSGYTNCGDYIEFVDQRKINLNGFSLDSLAMNLSMSGNARCNSTNVMTVIVNNLGSEATKTSHLEIVLPQGCSYLDSLANDLGAPSITQQNGNVVLDWNLPTGYIASQQQKTITLAVILGVASSDVTNLTFSSRVYQTGDALCQASNETCATKATSGSATLSVPIQLSAASINIDYQYYVCTYHFKSALGLGNDCAITSYHWDFGDNATSSQAEPFHAYGSEGTYTVSLAINYDCGGCVGSQVKSIQLHYDPSVSAYRDSIVFVSALVKQRVLSSSASTFSDSWAQMHVDENLKNKNSFLNGSRGVWRNDASYVYKVDRDTSAMLDISKDGTYTMEQFDWHQGDLNVIPNWIKATNVTQYSPFSYELENRDVLGIYSAALYDYGGHLPSANGVNMRNAEMAFTSFEHLDNANVSGNWIVGSQSVPTYTIYNVSSGFGNLAITDVGLNALDDVTVVDVSAKRIPRRLMFFGLIPYYLGDFNYISNDSIVCKSSFSKNKTSVILSEAPFSGIWNGALIVRNHIDPVVVANIDGTVAHAGKSSLHITANQTFKQGLIQLDSGKAYVINAWVSVNVSNLLIPKLADNLGIDLTIRNKHDVVNTTFSFEPVGSIIEGWQQVRGTFTCPINDAHLEITFKPGSTGQAWYDDLRLFPEHGNMKSYVYDLTDYKLTATLDEDNFASFYYYDKEGNLHLVKKETEDGMKTLSENVTYTIENRQSK